MITVELVVPVPRVAATDEAKRAWRKANYCEQRCAELGMGTSNPIDLYVDNRSAIDVAYNPEHHGRMKHVDRRHFYVRELVENHVIRVPFVETTKNYADIFTKPLAAPTFFPLRDKIMNVPEHLREPVRESGR